MEKVTVSKIQAVELAKDIVEARDAKLALLMQLQEIVMSTTALPDLASASCEDLEEGPSQPFLVGIDVKGWFPVGFYGHGYVSYYAMFSFFQ